MPVQSQTATNKHGIIIILAAVMPAMAILSLVPVMPLLMREFSGVDGFKYLVPVALTIPALCVALFSPAAGWLSDRIGRKGLLIAALLAYAAIGILPFFLTDLKQIIGARVGLGIAEAIIMTVSTALIGDYYEGAEREKWIGIQIGFVSVAAIFIIAMGGMLGQILGSRGPFLLYLLALPIALMGMIILFEPKITQKAKDIKQSLPWLALLPLFAITLACGVLFYTAVVKSGAILSLVGEASPAMIGGVGAGMNVGMVLGTVLFGKMKKASGPKLLSMGMLMVAVGYMGMSFSSSLPMTVTFAIMTSLGAGVLLPTMLTWTMQKLPDQVRGRGTGIWTGMFFLGQFLAPMIATSLIAPAKGLTNVLLIYGVFAALAAILAALRSRGAESLKH